MLDQCIITVPNGPLVKPQIFTDEKFEIDGWLQFYAVNNSNRREFNKEGPVHKGAWTFELFGPRVVRFRTRHVGTRKDPFCQVIDQIDLNLAKVAHGHNAIPIWHQQELCGLLILVRHVLRGVLVNPDEASTLIPGLVNNSRANWSKLEIGAHYKDQGRNIFEAMKRMRSPYARKCESFDNTNRLKGTNVLIKAYDKPTQMVAKKSSTMANLEPSTDHPITKLEVELWGRKAASFGFLPEDQRPLIRMDDGKAYLEGFTLEQLLAIFRHYFSTLKAVYHKPKKPGGGDAAGMAAVLAAVHLRSGMPVDELVGLYAELGMRDRKETRPKDKEEEARKRAQREMRSMIERYLEESSTLTADELLSDAAFRSQPIIGVKGRYGFGDMFIKHYDIDSIWDFANDPHADRQIKDVYMGMGSKVFTPTISLEEWWREIRRYTPRRHKLGKRYPEEITNCDDGQYRCSAPQ